MDMQVLAPRDGLHHLADVDAVLDDGVAGPVVLERQLVPDGDIALRGHGDVLVVFHDPAAQGLPGPDAFDHDDADAVAFFMHDKMDHAFSSHLCVRGNVILFVCPTAADSCRHWARWESQRLFRELLFQNSKLIPSPSGSHRATPGRAALCCGRGSWASSTR